MTEDVDALVRLDENARDRFLEMAKAEGVRPRIPRSFTVHGVRRGFSSNMRCVESKWIFSR